MILIPVNLISNIDRKQFVHKQYGFKSMRVFYKCQPQVHREYFVDLHCLWGCHISTDWRIDSISHKICTRVVLALFCCVYNDSPDGFLIHLSHMYPRAASLAPMQPVSVSESTMNDKDKMDGIKSLPTNGEWSTPNDDLLSILPVFQTKCNTYLWKICIGDLDQLLRPMRSHRKCI